MINKAVTKGQKKGLKDLSVYMLIKTHSSVGSWSSAYFLNQTCSGKFMFNRGMRVKYL